MSLEKDAIRIYILQIAWQQVGSHYLTGTDGATPGGNDGLSRTVDLSDDSEWDTLAVHMGSRPSRVCFGRYEQVNGYLLNPNDKAKYDAFKAYYEEQSKTHISPYYWKPFEDNLFPRRLDGKGSAICLAEDCRGVRHFDCIGYVNWVLTKALGKNFKYDTVQYQGNKNKGGIGSGVVAPVEVSTDLTESKLKSADILTKIQWKEKTDDKGNKKWVVSHDHIGFFVEGGKVLEASGKKVGVILSNYKKSDWQAVCRIHDSYLKFGS